jgi:D-alanyl-D-alanine carboxypeptidase (penicillin-binding protein 5/6)
MKPSIIKQILRAAFLCLAVLCLCFKTNAQVEEIDEQATEDSIAIILLGEDDEVDTLVWIDSLLQGNAQVEFDNAFNFDFSNALTNDSLSFRAGLLYDLESNTVVWQKDMNYAYPIASVSKIMTSLLAIEALNAGKVNWNDDVKVTSKRTVYIGRRRSRRKKVITSTVSYTLRDLLKMTMIESNNYAAELVGKHISSGSTEAFVLMMNERAQELKMYNTFFSNPSGLPASRAELDNSSSPHDLLLLSKEALKHDDLIEIASMGYAPVDNGRSTYTIRNHNGLVREYVNEIDGLKTGFTKRAGFCLVATSKRYNHRLIAIVLGHQSVWARNNHVSNLCNNYYQVLALGEMGTILADTLLEKVKPGYCNEDFNYSAVARKIPASVKNELVAGANEEIRYKTIVEPVRKTHVVKSGDTMSKIANKYNVTVAEIKKWNRLKSTTVRKGQRLMVMVDMKKLVPYKVQVPAVAVNENEQIYPVNNAVAHADSVALQTYTKPGYIMHTVQTGDTLWNIAQRYKLNGIDEIKKLNHFKNNHIRIGQKVKVPLS